MDIELWVGGSGERYRGTKCREKYRRPHVEDCGIWRMGPPLVVVVENSGALEIFRFTSFSGVLCNDVSSGSSNVMLCQQYQTSRW